MRTATNTVDTITESAIKAKLVELGAYVDDELPDYIMVMIANKKTKEQMTNDLNLFLGKNSAIFTDWVNGVLDRLQAISQKASLAPAAPEKPKKDKREHRATRKDENLIKNAPNEQAKDDFVKKSKNRLRIEYPKRESKIDGAKVVDESSRAEKYSEKIEQRRKKHKRISPPRRSRDIVHDSDTLRLNDDFLGDEKELDGRKRKYEKLESDNVRKQSDSKDARQRIQDRINTTSRVSSVYQPEVLDPAISRPAKRRTVATEEQKLSESSQKRRSVVGQVVHRKVEEEDYEIDYKKNTFSISSTVKVTGRKNKMPSSMQAKPSIFLKALNEANKSVSRLKCAIKLEEEKRLERRIIDESEIIEDPEEIVPSIEESDEDAYVPDAVPPTSLTDKNDTAKATSPGQLHFQTNAAEYIPTPIRREKTLPGTTSRKVERIDKLTSPAAASTVDFTQEDTLIVDTAQEKNDQSTRFFVTLDGVDSSFIEKIEPIRNERGRRSQKPEKSIDTSDFSAAVSYLSKSPSREKRKSLETDDLGAASPKKRRKIVDDRCETTNEKRRDDSNASSSREKQRHDFDDRCETTDEKQRDESVGRQTSPEIQQLDTIGVGFDDEDDDNTAAATAGLLTASLTSPLAPNSLAGGASNGSVSSQTIKEVKICLDTDDEEDDANDSNYKRKERRIQNDLTRVQITAPLDKEEKVMERCKYWPACKLGSACSFHHPTVPCKAFPTCRFGDRCLYLHPKCRYDALCANKNCPFSHSVLATKRSAPYFDRQDLIAVPDVANVLSSVAIPACKYGGRCTNPACTFRHPKPCAFGSNCLRSDCAFSHPIVRRTQQVTTALFTTQKFKWVSSATRLSSGNSL